MMSSGRVNKNRGQQQSRKPVHQVEAPRESVRCPKCGATEIKEWEYSGEHWCRRCAWTWGGQREGCYTGEGMSMGKDGLFTDVGFFDDEDPE